MVEDEFNKRFGWIMIAKNVSDFENDTLKNILQSNAMYVLTIATLLNEQIELIEIQAPAKY